MKQYKQIGKLRPLLVGVGPLSYTLVVLSSSHARNSNALVRENGACFIFIRQLLFMNYLFYLFIYDLLFMTVNL